MSEHAPASTRRKVLRRAAISLGALLLAYVGFGFLAAPPLARGLLERKASAALHREVRVARVRVNPLALSATVEGLSVRHRDGSPFVSWDSLYVRLAPWRLVAGDVGVAEIRLARPRVEVALGADGALSFQDLLAPDGAPAPAPAPGEKRGGLGVWIGRLAVEEARVRFRDATRHPAFDEGIGPLTFQLESFRTKGGDGSPYSFVGTTDAGERFRWTGTVQTEPVRSAGTLAFERVALPRYAPYLQESVPLDLRDGRLDLETRYELEWGAARHAVKLSAGRLVVDKLALGPRGVAHPPVNLTRLEVTGIEADPLAREARVGEVALQGAALRVAREADGTFELARMAPPPSSKPAPEPWRWSVGAIRITGARVDVEDRAAPRPVAIALGDLDLRLAPLANDSAASTALDLSLAWNGSGRFSAKGEIQPLAKKGALRLAASALDLTPLAPYLEPGLAARLAGGRAGAELAVTFDASGAAPRWKLAGDARIEALAVAEKGNDELLRWTALEVAGIEATSQPPSASVRLVRLVEPSVKAYVWEDGATSFARAAGTPAAKTAAPAARAAPPTAPGWRTAIGAVQIVRGKAVLVDRSVSPAAVLRVTRADGKVASLSSDPRVRSTVDLRLEVSGASPVRVAGTLNPLQKDAYTDLTVASEGVDLSPFDSYAGKFLGYGIRKGKLDLDLRYQIRNRNLASTNVIKVNQFTLGDSTDSPDATKLPVRLALALLQDKDGVILLDVPIDGNLDDPDFHVGKVVWRAILNVLGKVATSPFRALAALVGGGGDADLSVAEFVPGTAEPLPAAKEQLAALARSLAQRPAVSLEVEGVADEAQDGAALRAAALERSLHRAEAARLARPPESADALVLSSDERSRLVRAAYAAALPPEAASSKAAPLQPPSLAEMEARLAAAAPVPADAYRALAAERAQRAREVLVAAGLDQSRLFLTEGGERAQKEKGARVYFTAR